MDYTNDYNALRRQGRGDDYEIMKLIFNRVRDLEEQAKKHKSEQETLNNTITALTLKIKKLESNASASR